MRLVLTLSASLIAAGAAGAAEQPLPPPAAGPISVDMSIAAAKAAAPSVPWKDEISPHTGRTISITGDAAWTLEGHAYQVLLRPMAYGAAILSLKGTHEVPDVDACRARFVALATHFDRYFDAMEPRWTIGSQFPQQGRATTVTAQRSPDGNLFVTAQPSYAAADENERKPSVLTAGRNARLQQVLREDGSAAWDFIKLPTADYRYSIGADASFRPDDLSDKRVCSITVNVRSHPPGVPMFDTLDTTKVKPIASPSVATRHRSIDGLELPPEGLSFVFRCEVNRATGQLQACFIPDSVNDGSLEKRAARARLSEYRYDPKRLDPDNDVTLKTEITIKLLPGDRNPKMAAAAPAHPVWTQTASASELSRHYPAKALADGIEARVVATCKIEPDLTLACDSFQTDPPGLTVFEDATKRILSKYRAAPRLKNDAPAAGAVVKVPLRFEFEN